MSPFKIIKEMQAHRCEDCGVLEPGRRLHVHHIDADRTNNRIANLRVLCINCHAAAHSGTARADILAMLRSPRTARELIELTGYSRRRVYELIRELDDDGAIEVIAEGYYNADVWLKAQASGRPRGEEFYI